MGRCRRFPSRPIQCSQFFDRFPMALDPLSPAAFAFIVQVEAAFSRLMRYARPASDPDSRLGSDLGGKLVYAGDLDEPGRAFTVAAGIAGAATLAACAQPAAAKQAVRDGVCDFLVNSLDEALRILKNQVRKREAVAVCVSAASAAIDAEMRGRGVQPDLLYSDGVLAPRREPATGLLDRIDAAEDRSAWLTWRVADAPARWLPKLDGLALGVLDDVLASDSPAPDPILARRWIERAPAYLGRMAHNARTLRTTERAAEQMAARFRSAISSGEIAAPVELAFGPWPTSRTESLVLRG
jgi:urocanate hydratase